MGPPGTGKTMASALIAREAGVELYRVSLSDIVSKWVGETEKNLEKIFRFAEQYNVALLFDEADSLFGARTSVNSASDRYANLETNYLLQRIENFAGMVILTTNFGEAIDEAFERRIRFRIRFLDPDAPLRLRLWQSMIPSGVPLSDDIDFETLASGFEFSGGHIKEAVLQAAFEAAEQNTPIHHAYLWRSAEAQYRKMGKLYRPHE
jgi:SpoVK/Ycf46/Vps4 family AAA+-type ATPase